MSSAADDYLTIDEVAQRMTVSPEMIRRRIESGDIPVHWVEQEGRLEMRVSAAEVGVSPGAQPFTGQGPGAGAELQLPEPGGPELADDWSPAQPAVPSELWAPPDEPSTGDPWESPLESETGPSEQGGIPVWRPDPATWEDEPLEAAAAPEPPQADPQKRSPSFQASADFLDRGSVDPQESAPEPFPSFAPASAPEEEPEQDQQTGSLFAESEIADAFEPPDADDEEEPAFTPQPLQRYDEPSYQQEEVAYPDEEPSFAADEPEQLPAAFGAQPVEEVARPSALAAAPSAEGSGLAINSIDARELVSGLFERWERALEQRIQAEQRLRFEAELERRLRQVRDLRQELDNTRKSQAAQLAEHEREMMELRNKLREAEQSRPRGRLFKR